MSVNNKKGPIIDPGVCRCCGSTKKCRLLNVEYEWLGQKEVYSDIFVDTFGLMLSHLDTEPEDRLICATCVTRLRDASSFRRQVLQWEERLLQAKIQVDEDSKNQIKQESDLKEETEAADLLEDSHYASDNSNDLDYEPTLSELKKEIKLSPKKVKKEKKSKRTKKKCKENQKAKKEMLESLREMEKQLEQIQEYDEVPLIPTERHVKRTETEQKSFQNTIIIVENSYVCPFETSYSDYYCIYCREVFTDPDKLRQHTLSHDPSAFKDIIVSKKIAQIDISRIDCRLCTQMISNIEDLKNHLIVHGKSFTEENEFLKFKLTANNLTCLECGGVFKYFHALKKHMAEHFGTCICDVCGAHYFEERMLAIHQKTHIKIDQNFPCTDCGKIFKSKHSRYLHETKTHKKEAAYMCSKCDETFFSYSLRYRHMIDVHGEERLFQCDHCERAYDSRKSLREHNRRCHLKLFKHQCDLCDKRFYLPSRLKEHMSTHTGERNFRCEFCGKSYPRFRGLKVHMQSHSSEKKFRCPMCNTSFTQNVNLKNHMKRQHQRLDLEDASQIEEGRPTLCQF